MKVTRDRAELNRELVIEAASELFRERGFDGISIAEIMHSVGLTVGGFYKSFESKDDLLAHCCRKISEQSLTKWGSYVTNPKITDPLKKIGSSYLSSKNRDDLKHTCIFTTLAPEAPRHSNEVKDAFSNSVDLTIEFLSTIVAGDTEHSKRMNAISTFSQWVGALILSRAAGDSELSIEILEAVKAESSID